VAASRRAGCSGGGDDGRREKANAVNESGASFGGSGTGGRRLRNVLVASQKPLRPSTPPGAAMQALATGA